MSVRSYRIECNYHLHLRRLYRLTQAAASNGDVYQYAYDAAGNRTLRVEPGVNETAVCRVKMVRVRR